MERRNDYRRHSEEYKNLFGLSKFQPIEQVAARSEETLHKILDSGNKHYIQLIDVYLYTKYKEMVDKGIISE